MGDKDGSKQKIFSEVSYFIALECSDEVQQSLKQGGAAKEFYISDLVTHVISDSYDFVLADEAKEYNIPVVTQNWVKMSLKAGKKLPTQPFSPKSNQLFTDMRICPSKLPGDDLTKLWAMVTFHGGHCQLNLTPSCTHLVIPKANGEKYNMAAKLEGKIKIVTPSWVVSCIKENKLLDEGSFVPVEETEKGQEEGSHLKESSESQETVDDKPVLIETATTGDQFKTSESSKDTGGKLPQEESCVKEVEEPCTPVATTGKKIIDSNTLSSPTQALNGSASKEADKETKKSPVREVLEIKETPVKTEGESTDAEPLDSVLTSRHEECSGEQKEHGTSQVKTAETEQKSGNCQDKGDLKRTEKEDNSTDSESSPLLSGCVFVIIDYQNCMDHSILNTWIEVIKSNGGEVEMFYSQRCTHVLCLYQQGKLCKQALQDGKKVVTAHWLNDVLTEKKMSVPSKALHFPQPFEGKLPQCKNLTITVTGYTDTERLLVKNMIHNIGASYTGYLTRSNTQVICKYAEGTKYIKAKEWGIPCISAKWLGDILSTGKVPPCALKKYTLYGKDDDLVITKENVKDLLVPWKDDIAAEESIQRKRKLDGEHKDSEVQNQPKRQRLSDSVTVEVNSNNPHVLFTGLTIGKSASLMKMLEQLGGVPATCSRTCTHLVATKIVRTAKFLSAISVCQFIVTPEWLEKSFEAKKFLDPRLFSLRDEETEKEYNMDLLTSIKRAQCKPLLQDIKVYATPNVQPKPSSLKEIVEAAGGQFVTDSVNKSTLASFKALKTKEGKPGFIVVTCQEDLKHCIPFLRHGIDIHSTEIILAGVLTQKLDYTAYKVQFVN